MICLCVQKLQQTKHKHTQAIHFEFGAVLCCCKSLSNLLGLWEGRMERFKRIGKKKYDTILCNSYLIWFDLIWFDCNEVEHQIFVCSIFFLLWNLILIFTKKVFCCCYCCCCSSICLLLWIFLFVWVFVLYTLCNLDWYTYVQ